jgi:hypothetical protein
MNAKELRIGNWVMYSSKIQVNENKIKECVEHPSRFQPIPITEEWLDRFRFSDIEEVDDFKQYRRFDDPQKIIQFPRGSEAHFYAGNYPVAIRYVHQLQNLFYALTGKEL